mmetsp:Transcript_13440/g.25324  ORF Transcript_13440/g.25324 Transcript_13440/m.25324 type:complete len:532 (-) Transcript_13440:881-2476(-)
MVRIFPDIGNKMQPFERTILALLLLTSSIYALLLCLPQTVEHSDLASEADFPIKLSQHIRRLDNDEDEGSTGSEEDEDDTSWPDELSAKVYIGNWKLKKAPLKGFESKSGRTYLDADYDTISKDVRIVMTMFDGEWEDDPVNLILMRHGVFDFRNRSIVLHNSTMEFYDSSGLDIGYNNECDAYLNLDFNEDDGVYSVEGYFASVNCGFFVQLSFDQFTEDMQKSSRVTYCGIFTVLNIIIFLSIAQHTQDCMESEMYAKRTSILSLLLNASTDLTLCLWHMKLAMSYFITFDFMVLAALWSFSLYMMVQHRLAELVWKAQNSEISAQGWRVMRRRYTAFNTRFFIAVVVIAAVGYVFQFIALGLILVVHSSWIPQIVRNAVHGYRKSWRFQITLKLILARYALLFYIFGCPANFLSWRPKYWYVGVLFILMVTQVTLLWLQMSLGPRFFVPQRFRPQIYSYYRNLDEENGGDPLECMICLNALREAGDTSEVKSMHTPCGHTYHEECLKRWMDVKMQCPTCRSELPIVEE